MNATNGLTALLGVAQRMMDQLAAFAPTLLGALGLLLGGWLVGRLLARGITKLIDTLIPGLEERATRVTLARLGIERRLAELVGRFVFWVVLVVFAAAAVETLGLPVVAAWVGQLGALLPRLLVGGLIVVVGLFVGSVAREAVSAAARAGGAARADLLGRIVQGAVVVTAVVTGLEQIGVDSRFLTMMMVIVTGGAIGGIALAFAFGARTEVSNLVAMHYVRQAYRTGQLIQVGGIGGRIAEFTRTTVIVATPDGQAHVPGRMFSEQVTTLPAAEE
ncbi:MAG: mechanosensitive ion channel [Acidobacteria bacterium]|nr:mechanosensitive ion channel [Acidobacteriota bacterium]